MRRRLAVLTSVPCLLAALAGPAFGISNGAPDGNTHPAIGMLLATNDSNNICAGNHQFISSCSVTLIAPDLALTHGNCTAAFRGGLDTGLVNEIWIIFDQDPFDNAISAFDCTKFTDVDETEIVTNPNPSLGVIRLAQPVSIPPVQLPIENRLQNVPRGLDRLTSVAMGATSATVGFDLRNTLRRSWLGRTDPPLEAEFHHVTLEEGGSPVQACFGASFTDGGAVFVEGTNEVVSLTQASSPCSPMGRLPRLDTPAARDFLDDYVTVP